MELEEKTLVVIGTLTSEEDTTLDLLLRECSQSMKETEKTTGPNIPFLSSATDVSPVMDSQERDDYNLEQKGETKPMTSTKDAMREMDYGQEDSESTIIQDYYIVTDIEYSTSNTVTETTKETHKENAVASEVQITSVKEHANRDEKTDNEEDDTIKEITETTSTSNKEKLTERHELKEVQVKLRKLSAQEISKATKSKTVKPKHVVKKLKQSVKSTHAPATLRKDTIGTIPKFTFSTYKLARKKWRNYIFHCTVSGCKKVFNSVKNWNSHHLCLH